MSIKARIERIENRLTPEPQIRTRVIMPTVEPGYVALLLDHTGEEKLLTQADYDQLRAQSPNMRVIRPRVDA